METAKKIYGSGVVSVKLTTISKEVGVNFYEFKFPYSDKEGCNDFSVARKEASDWFDTQISESGRMVAICGNLLHKIEFVDASDRGEVNSMKSITMQSF